MNQKCYKLKRVLNFMLTNSIGFGIVSTVVRICASGSAVEHLLAKEGVAGSIPVSRSERKRTISIDIVLFSFRAQFWARSSIVSSPTRSALNRCHRHLAPSRAHAQFWARSSIVSESFCFIKHKKDTNLIYSVTISKSKRSDINESRLWV